MEMINAEVLEKSNLTYEIIGKKTVTISYEVRIRDRYKISASDFYVYADLAEMYDVTGSVPVKIEDQRPECESDDRGNSGSKTRSSPCGDRARFRRNGSI